MAATSRGFFKNTTLQFPQSSYRGFVIRVVINDITGTDSVLQDDGSWRACEPTIMGMEIYFEILKSERNGELFVVDRAESESQAKSIIDTLVG